MGFLAKQCAGKILITGSEASLAPIALMTIYAATKAFVYSFALSLREELKDSGVTVKALLPGATQTNFFMRAKMEKAKFVREGKMADPADVARDGYKALIKGDDHIVTPLTDKIGATLAKFVPDRMALSSGWNRRQGVMKTLMQPSSLSRNFLYAVGASRSGNRCVMTKDGSISPFSMR
jgi:short-subunit dehydrogenase